MLFTGWCSTAPTLLRTFVCRLVGKMVIQKAHECSSCYAWLSVFIDVIKLVLPGIVSSSYPPLAIWKGSHNSSFWVVAIVGFFLQLDHQVEPLLTTRLSTWGKFQGFDPLPEAPVTGAAFAWCRCLRPVSPPICDGIQPAGNSRGPLLRDYGGYFLEGVQ